jgi:KRAB domain-containing zinc finger protein
LFTITSETHFPTVLTLIKYNILRFTFSLYYPIHIKFSSESTFIANYNQHYIMGKKAPQWIYKCPHCDHAPFQHRCRLETHMESHVIKEQVECRICNKVLKHKQGLLRHLNTTHTVSSVQPTSYDCPRCKQSFCHKKRYDNHVKLCNDPERVGSSEKSVQPSSYECSRCKKSFRYKKPYDNHVKLCSDPERFTERVEKRKVSDNPKKDKRIKDTIKHLQCSECDYKTDRKCSLKAHIKEQHREKKLKCPHCDRRFSNATFRRMHVSTYHNPSLYNCPKCGLGLATEHLLNCHIPSIPYQA